MISHNKEWLFLTESINQLAYVTEMECILYDVQIIFLNIFIWISYFKGLSLKQVHHDQ
jgi:hypothetical protein